MEGGELDREQLQHSLEVVIGGVLIRPDALGGIRADRVADVGGDIDVEHVSVVVPRPVVECEVVGTVLHGVGAVLLGPSEHGRAAGAAIEPNNDGVGSGIVSAESSQVVELLLGVWNLEISRVETVRDVWLLPEL